MKVYKNFDANASHTLLSEVKESIAKFNLDFLNPSAVHQSGQKAKAIIEEARYNLASLMQLSAKQRIVFTSGASEANNQAIFYAAKQSGEFSPLSSAIEHPSVLEALKNFPGTKYLLPDYTAEHVLANVSEQTNFLSLMFANNETGYILPITEIFAAVKQKHPEILLHTDAVQALGKLSVDFSGLQADFITVSGHKIGALSGIGALVVNDDLAHQPLIYGGPQEQRWRAGTENVLGIYTFGVAAKVWQQKQAEKQQKMLVLRDNFEKAIHQAFPEAIINHQDKKRLPNTSSIYLPGILADDLVVAMDLKGFAISSGAACSSGKPLPSHVLLAMGHSEEYAKSTVRVSFEENTTASELDSLINGLCYVLGSS